MKKNFVLLCLGCIVLLLNSCLNGEEEFWFERDGSGRLEAEYELPVFAIASMGGEGELRHKIDDFFARGKGVTLETFSMERRGTQTVMKIKANFSSVRDLVNLLGSSGDTAEGSAPLPGPMVELFGEFQVSRDGRMIDFRRHIDPKGIFGGGLLSPSAKQLEGYHLQYIVHLPTKVATSNAHEIRDGGYTAVWRYSLADAMKHPIDTNFTAPIPLPWWVYVIFTLLLLMTIFLTRWLVRQMSKKTM